MRVADITQPRKSTPYSRAEQPSGKPIAHAEQVRKLNAIGIALSNERNLNRLLELIVTEARLFTNADGGSLYIIEDGKLHFVVAQTASLEKRRHKKSFFKAFYLPLSEASIAGYVATTGKTLNILDVYTIPEELKYSFNKTFDEQNDYRSKSMLVVPMRGEDNEVIGVLQLINSLDTDGNIIAFKTDYQNLIQSLASQAGVAIRNVQLIEEIRNLFRSLVRYSVKAIDARSPHTAGHSGRVARYSVHMAEAINKEERGPLAKVMFTPQAIEELRMAGWLHDIGKIGVRESVLEKTNKLTDDQLEVIRQRFDSIKNGVKCRFLEKEVQSLREQNSKPGERNITVLHSRMLKELQRIDDNLAFIERINVPDFLRKQDKKRLDRLVQQHYIDGNGISHSYITEHEFEHLAVVSGNLTDPEYREMQSHVHQTISILRKIPFTRDLENIPKYTAAHHEYLDGTGYPYGLKGKDIPMQSRILCIADIFDALTAPDRPYKTALEIEETVDILNKEASAGKLDSNIVQLFIREKLYLLSSVDDD